ncbi:MAG: NUDIX domain-containing protein [Rhodospirillaceae bacterium]|nr:MAG: NUDIX domain-containing protein [Rhodospirillaceae bacterium]
MLHWAILRRSYPFLERLRNVLRHLWGMKAIGICAIVRNAQGEILLVKHTYRFDWYLPGGGLRRGEAPADGIRRELREEVGLELTGTPRLLQVYLHHYNGMIDYPILYEVTAFNGTAHAADRMEITEIGWFPPDRLPPDISQKTRLRIEEWLGQRPVGNIW